MRYIFLPDPVARNKENNRIRTESKPEGFRFAKASSSGIRMCATPMCAFFFPFTLPFTAFFGGRLFGDLMAMRVVRSGSRWRSGGGLSAWWPCPRRGWCNVGFATQRDSRYGNGEMGDVFFGRVLLL
jgi:hypothetical protein